MILPEKSKLSQDELNLKWPKSLMDKIIEVIMAHWRVKEEIRRIKRQSCDSVVE